MLRVNDFNEDQLERMIAAVRKINEDYFARTLENLADLLAQGFLPIRGRNPEPGPKREDPEAYTKFIESAARLSSGDAPRSSSEI